MKTWSSWLKWGLIISLIALIRLIILFVMSDNIFILIEKIFIFPDHIILYPIAFLCNSENTTCLLSAALIHQIIYAFIFGVIIGLILGKKNWPSWLKGGIILVLYHGFIPISLFLIDLIMPNPRRPLNFISFVYSFLYLILYYFIIGALIGWMMGWLYRKYKAKKQQPVQTQPQVQTK